MSKPESCLLDNIEVSLARIEAITYKQKEAFRSLYGWFKVSVLRNEESRCFRTEDSSEITITPLTIPPFPHLPRLRYAIYISKDTPDVNSRIEHHAYLLGSDGKIFVTLDYRFQREEYNEFIEGKSLDLIEEDLPKFRLADIYNTRDLLGIIRDEILPEVLATS